MLIRYWTFIQISYQTTFMLKLIDKNCVLQNKRTEKRCKCKPEDRLN